MKKVLTEKDLRKATKDTCFKSLAYCCGLKRECFARDKAMKNIGLTKKDYVCMKKIFDRLLLFVLETR